MKMNKVSQFIIFAIGFLHFLCLVSCQREDMGNSIPLDGLIFIYDDPATGKVLADPLSISGITKIWWNASLVVFKLERNDRGDFFIFLQADRCGYYVKDLNAVNSLLRDHSVAPLKMKDLLTLPQARVIRGRELNCSLNQATLSEYLTDYNKLSALASILNEYKREKGMLPRSLRDVFVWKGKSLSQSDTYYLSHDANGSSILYDPSASDCILGVSQPDHSKRICVPENIIAIPLPDISEYP